MPPEFVIAIHHLLSRIPAGSVATYGLLADLAGYPGYARHVGKVLSMLPDDSRLPWYRVVRADLTVSRPGTDNATRQMRLLLAENVRFKGARVSSAHVWVP